MPIESLMPSNHLFLSHPLLLLPSIFLSIRWPNYWSFSFSISPSSEYSGLISFRVDWFGLQTSVHGYSYLSILIILWDSDLPLIWVNSPALIFKIYVCDNVCESILCNCGPIVLHNYRGLYYFFCKKGSWQSFFEGNLTRGFILELCVPGKYLILLIFYVYLQ